MVPCIVFEDEDLLVVNKPAGLNTHAPDPYAGEGLYDWLRHREPRWASLAIIHRLDKETSGLIAFSKSPLANRSLTEQFTRRKVHKKYLLLTAGRLPGKSLTARTTLVRAGERYVSRPGRAGELAETHFRLVGPAAALPPHPQPVLCVEAEPRTGRTHQIRVHAADNGFAILGDVLYDGATAERVYLHAAEIAFQHPASGQHVSFRSEPQWAADPRLALRTALVEPGLTDCFRVIHGASDGWPGWHVEKLGGYLLSQSESPAAPAQHSRLEALARGFQSQGAFHKRLDRQVRGAAPAAASPHLLFGAPPAQPVVVRENGLQFELSFSEGYSVGLFLDQRDNRRRLLTRHAGAGVPLLDAAAGTVPEVLNTFAYTCGFSVCAAKAGARTTSLDLSKKYLEWGRRNFLANGLDPAAHDFIFGDVFDWVRRLHKKERQFDLVLLDPPTFSQSRQSGVFRAEKDYGKLVSAALPLIKPSGVLFASSNAAGWDARAFINDVRSAVASAGRKIRHEQYFPQPPDFPVSRGEPAYLKTLWLRLD